jgi:predicted nucleic acid-binding protein
MPAPASIEPPKVFIDTGAFVAIHVPNDPNHPAAIRCRDQTIRFFRLYTSSAVIAETVTHIQRDRLLDRENLDDLIGDFLKPDKWISFLPVDDDVLMRSLRMVRDKRDRRLSLVDATNNVLMEMYQIDRIFTFDALYDGVTVMRGYNARFLERIPQ